MGSRDATIESDTGRSWPACCTRSAPGTWTARSATRRTRSTPERHQPPLEDRRRAPPSACPRRRSRRCRCRPPAPTTSTTGPRTATRSATRCGRPTPARRRRRCASSTPRPRTELPKFKMEGGNVGLALGAEWRKETLKDRPSAATAGGDILGQGSTSTDGSRTSEAIYGELSPADPEEPRGPAGRCATTTTATTAARRCRRSA